MGVTRFQKQIARTPTRLPIVLGLHQIVRLADVRRQSAREQEENQKNPKHFERRQTPAAMRERRFGGSIRCRHAKRLLAAAHSGQRTPVALLSAWAVTDGGDECQFNRRKSW